MGATAGRTTLNGEGLQHEDGHSHVLASTLPNCMAYDPAYHYEIATIIRDGLERMYGEKREPIFYYITLYNENYPQLGKPEGSEEGILKGLYRVRPSAAQNGAPRVQILGSGSLLREAMRAQEILASEFNVAADVWSATSYKQLRYEAMECERWNLLHPGQPPRVPWVTQQLGAAEGPVIAVSDYMRLVPDQVSKWVPQGLTSLGTDGYGRSDTREALRRHFEIDAEAVVIAALVRLVEAGKIGREVPSQAMEKLGVDPEKVFSLYA
jgi:pyruvate dehydrogenase E1 component